MASHHVSKEGSITFQPGGLTLTELESFIAEARRLGVPEDAKLKATTFGSYYYFVVPVEFAADRG